MTCTTSVLNVRYGIPLCPTGRISGVRRFSALVKITDYIVLESSMCLVCIERGHCLLGHNISILCLSCLASRDFAELCQTMISRDGFFKTHQIPTRCYFSCISFNNFHYLLIFFIAFKCSTEQSPVYNEVGVRHLENCRYSSSHNDVNNRVTCRYKQRTKCSTTCELFPLLSFHCVGRGR